MSHKLPSTLSTPVSPRGFSVRPSDSRLKPDCVSDLERCEVFGPIVSFSLPLVGHQRLLTFMWILNGPFFVNFKMEVSICSFLLLLKLSSTSSLSFRLVWSHRSPDLLMTLFPRLCASDSTCSILSLAWLRFP